jgi:selenocysteine-specific elongation factor
MRTQRFEASLIMEKKGAVPPGRITVFSGRNKAPGAFHVYETFEEPAAGRFFGRIVLRRPLSLQWNDPFEFSAEEKREAIGRGTVLNPIDPEKERASKEADRDFLRALSGSDREMLAALCRSRGVQGLREPEIREFCGLTGERLLELSEDLEEGGKIKILAFSPLFLISRESFDFLCEKILDYLEQFHEKQPAQKGVLLEKIKKRFELPARILILAAKTLEKAGKARLVGQRLTRPSHEISLSPEEEKILQKLETMCFRGEFQSVGLKELQKDFRLSAERLERLLTLLIEKQKIIQGPEGLYIHAHWLDDIISKVRSLGKNELTVADFKTLTGLSRKYAIPLLELLDQMGVTRRQGPVREILPF